MYTSNLDILGDRYFTKLADEPTSKRGMLWPMAKKRNTNIEYKTDPFAVAAVAMIYSKAPHEGHDGISRRAKTMPKRKAPMEPGPNLFLIWR